jgi:DNA-binding GntR family transcriptional regulator
VNRDSKPVQRMTTAEVVAAQLREEIRRGEVPPGTWLRQGQVAERFGVSPTPVREAFARLQAEGLMRINAHRGAIVFDLTAEDLRESYAIRAALESLAVTVAIPKLTPEALAELEDLAERMREEEDPAAWTELNNRFHQLLVELSGWPRLSSMVANLRDASRAYIRTFVARASRRAEANREHREILAACRAGDADRAAAVMRQHLQRAGQVVIEDRLRAAAEAESS